MKYKQIVDGIFLARPNRFIAHVELDGKKEIVHVKNTGRCKELLIPGSKVYLWVADNPDRKTKYDLIAVEKQRDGKTPLLINMDSQVANDAAEEWLLKGELFSKDAVVRREVKFGNSRFDFYVEDGNRDPGKQWDLRISGCTYAAGHQAHKGAGAVHAGRV